MIGIEPRRLSTLTSVRNSLSFKSYIEIQFILKFSLVPDLGGNQAMQRPNLRYLNRYFEYATLERIETICGVFLPTFRVFHRTLVYLYIIFAS